MKFRPFVLVGFIGLIAHAEETAPRIDPIGRWRLAAAEYLGKPSPFREEDNVIWEIKNATIVETTSLGMTEFEYSVNHSKMPAEFDASGTTMDGIKIVWRGVIRANGGGLQVCVRAAFGGKTPKRATAFSTAVDDDGIVKMLLFTRER